VESFDAIPVKERSRIKENKQRRASYDDHPKINIVPGLFYPACVRHLAERIGDGTNGERNYGAADVDDVRFLRQDHPGRSHASAPKIVGRSKSPEPKQAE